MSWLRVDNLQRLHVGPVSFDMQAGECVTLHGRSGAGKTLLLRALADLDPHQGEVHLGEVAQSDVAGPRWRRHVGYLPAESGWWAVKVSEHFPPDKDVDLEALGLPRETLDWEVDRLSTGEWQRLALLRLLANEPRALLLDEPTANLDAESAERVEALVLRYRTRHKAPVLWVAHDEALRRRVGQRGLVIAAGAMTTE